MNFSLADFPHLTETIQLKFVDEVTVNTFETKFALKIFMLYFYVLFLNDFCQHHSYNTSSTHNDTSDSSAWISYISHL